MAFQSIFSMSQYLPEGPGVKEALTTYQYHGEDRSYIYKLFFRPLNTKLVQFVPAWVAPNVITVTGLILVIISHIMMCYYAPDLEDPGDTIPRWVYVMNAVTLFLYQTLDNLDGIQARRTGTSSPLGLIFDHGCDALNCTVGALTLASTLQTGPTWKTWVMMLNLVSVFFLNTWEEFYRGELVLPVINGANEGILLGILMHLATAVAGPGIWTQSVRLTMPMWAAHSLDTVFGWMPTWYSVVVEMGLSADRSIEVQYNTLVVFAMTFSAILTNFGNVFNVYQCIREGRGHGFYTQGYMPRKHPFLHSLTRLVPLYALITMANAWLAVSPMSVFRQHPRIASWTIGLLFSKLVTHLMVAHLCSREYHPVRKTLVPMLYLGLHVGFQYFNNNNHINIDEKMVLYEFFALSACTYIHLAVSVVLEMSKILERPIFTVPKAKK